MASLILQFKKLLQPIFNQIFRTSNLDINETFPLFRPSSAGTYNARAALTILAINQILPFLNTLTKHFKKKEIALENIECLSLNSQIKTSASELKYLLDKHGSDKANSNNYHHLYGAILRDKLKVRNIFEIGLGSNNPDIVSHMGMNNKPGASLRAFRDYCPNAFVYGADIDKQILFKEERIKTFFVDQTKPVTFDFLLKKIPEKFDLVIDDGLHQPNANIASFCFGLKIIKTGGWIVIEDISIEAICVWQIISSLLPNSYEPHIFSTDKAIIFAVKKLH